MKDLPEIMTLEEVASYLRVSERTIYEWAQKKKIPCGKLGTVWRFKRDDIQKWINDRLITQDEHLSEESYAPLPMQDLLSKDNVLIMGNASKQEVLYSLIDIVAARPEVTSKDDVIEGIFKRETLMSTGIGLGIAIPHIRLGSVNDLVMACALVKNGIADYATLDDLPVKLVFMIVANESQHAKHLKTVSQLSQKLKDNRSRELLYACETPSEFCDVFFNLSRVKQ